MYLGYGCKCVCIVEEEQSSLRVNTPHRGQSPGKSLLGFAVQPSYGKMEESEAQEGRDLPRALQLVSGRADSDSGSRALGLQPRPCSIPGSYCTLLEKGDKRTGWP